MKLAIVASSIGICLALNASELQGECSIEDTVPLPSVSNVQHDVRLDNSDALEKAQAGSARDKEREEIRKQLEQIKQELQKAREEEKRAKEESARKQMDAERPLLLGGRVRGDKTGGKSMGSLRERRAMREKQRAEAAAEKDNADASLELKIREFVMKHAGVEFGDSIEKFPQSINDPKQRRIVNLVEPRGYYDKAELYFTCGKLCSVCVFANFDKKYSRDSVDKEWNRTNASIEKTLGLDERNFKLARGAWVGRYHLEQEHADWDNRWYRGIRISDTVMRDELLAQKKKEDNAKGETLPPLD